MHQRNGHLIAKYTDGKIITIRSIYVIVDDNTVEMVYEGYYSSRKYNFINMKLPKWVIENFTEITNHE